MTVTLKSATPDAAGDRFSVPPSPRVLVADDQPANLQLVGSLLGRLGCEVIPAFDGRTALKRMALRTPDMILLDPLLPGMDGIETCRRIRRNPEWHHIPVVFVSTADDPDLIARALAAGGADYIKQPCTLKELAARLQTQLAGKKEHDLRLPPAGRDNEWEEPAEQERLDFFRELKTTARLSQAAKSSRRERVRDGLRRWRGHVAKLAGNVWILAAAHKPRTGTDLFNGVPIAAPAGVKCSGEV